MITRDMLHTRSGGAVRTLKRGPGQKPFAQHIRKLAITSRSMLGIRNSIDLRLFRRWIAANQRTGDTRDRLVHAERRAIRFDLAVSVARRAAELILSTVACPNLSVCNGPAHLAMSSAVNAGHERLSNASASGSACFGGTVIKPLRGRSGERSLDCKSAWGLDADQRHKILIYFTS